MPPPTMPPTPENPAPQPNKNMPPSQRPDAEVAGPRPPDDEPVPGVYCPACGVLLDRIVMDIEGHQHGGVDMNGHITDYYDIEVERTTSYLCGDCLSDVSGVVHE